MSLFLRLSPLNEWLDCIRTILEKWYTSIFFRNETFLLVKIESWNFQHLFDLGFRETSQNFCLFRQHSEDIFFYFFLVGISRNFVRFHEILNQTDAENFSFLSWQTKNWNVPFLQDSSFFNQQMAPWRPNFPNPGLCPIPLKNPLWKPGFESPTLKACIME